MQIGKLDHVNVRTTQLDVMIDWYTNVLGMENGPRPDFPFGGAWLYAGDGVASVHLVAVQGAAGTGSEVGLKLEHFAFSASGSTKFEQRLKDMDVPYQRAEVPSIKVVQYNVWDPDGNHIHIDFTD